MKLLAGLRNDPVQRARRRCLQKFLYYFPGGYKGKKYIAWERDYKWEAHLHFEEQLGKKVFLDLLDKGEYTTIAQRAVRIESKTNLLFSFEKMALRDAVAGDASAKLFTKGLYDYLYGKEKLQHRFENFVAMIGKLPRKQTRVLTWPLVTVFGFLAKPGEHIFLKPNVTRIAAQKYKFGFQYRSAPNWNTYQSLLDFAATIKAGTLRWRPVDNIDIQSFIWVMGSEEYPD
jgi:hypothetical protein